MTKKTTWRRILPEKNKFFSFFFTVLAFVKLSMIFPTDKGITVKIFKKKLLYLKKLHCEQEVKKFQWK
jgi:hypothetical protein